MFKKPLAHQSNATPIRSSARRQLAAAIIAQHPSLLPRSGTNGDDDTAEIAKEVAKAIVPESVRTGSIETSGGSEGVSVP
jgi:translation initiation factor 2D